MVALVAAVGTASVTGCSTSETVTSVQSTSNRPAPADAYPDFAKPLNAAMPQMSDDEARRQDAELSAPAARRQAGVISEADYLERVRKLRALASDASAQ